ncbi:hypothetical protein BJV82DRAFT_578297 [Fennellomyces sp. T-0311]|nr:hypothetical protein BJV82DRAFT_578297 [Fennellomyces sp. T-0311]
MRQSIALIKDIRLSSLPGLIGDCNYHEPGEDLVKMLDFDFRFAPSLLHAVAKLHTGALVYSEREAAMLLTCEAYSRSKATVVHSETSMKSIPKDGESIFVGMCEESDGGGAKQKLKIGGKHMNVLSTMSAIIGHDLLINIGPETKMADANYTIFYPEENVKIGNYGVSDTAAPKIAPRFLSTIAVAYLFNKCTVQKEQFEEVIQFFSANKTQYYRIATNTTIARHITYLRLSRHIVF